MTSAAIGVGAVVRIEVWSEVVCPWCTSARAAEGGTGDTCVV